MSGKRKVSRVATAIGVVLAATCGLALASHGWHGHGGGGRGGDGQLFLLASVAGVSKSTLASAFHGNTHSAQTDFSTLRTAHQAADQPASFPAPGTCDDPISLYEAAQQALTDRQVRRYGRECSQALLKSGKRQQRPGPVAGVEDAGACSAAAKAPDTQRNFRHSGWWRGPRRFYYADGIVRESRVLPATVTSRRVDACARNRLSTRCVVVAQGVSWLLRR